jgi:hypothetical protein
MEALLAMFVGGGFAGAVLLVTWLLVTNRDSVRQPLEASVDYAPTAVYSPNGDTAMTATLQIADSAAATAVVLPSVDTSD